MSIAVITTFPSVHWQTYAKDMLTSFVQNLPAEIPLLVQLDDDLVLNDVRKILRSTDAAAIGWNKDHLDFVTRNKGTDHPSDYRKQCVRFCHKVFAIHRAYQAVKDAKANNEPCARYLIWMDADTITNRPVSIDEIKECLPKEGDAVSYMGRKDWAHSECGWLAFDLENRGGEFIDVWHGLYVSDQVLKLPETHDSWVFDHIRLSKDAPKCTNLTEDKPGMEIWPHSPMGKWSTHKKGPVAKGLNQMKNSNIVIQTKNAIPHEQIREHIAENQTLIKNWIVDCIPTDEEIVIVSAGPQLMAEDVLEDYKAGKKIVAVKHALDRLKEADIKPWACILLDPRPHVYDFVKNPDTEILWFVASQVNPKVVMKLLAHGCTVWGYHASVGADEGPLTEKQPNSVVSGGSATATRGWFVLKKLGFSKFKLFGYDLCFPDKVDLHALDDLGQPKYLELSVGWSDPYCTVKKCFLTEPQLVAQFEEINHLIQNNTFELDAVGYGIIPFILDAKRGGEMRRAKLQAKISKPVSCEKLLKWNKQKKTNSLMKLLRFWSRPLRKMTPQPR